MKKFFYLSTCNTCNRIKSELNLTGVECQDVKFQHISNSELEFLRSKVNSYEELLNKRAQKYRFLSLKDKNLSQEQIKQYILEEYTLLKRPILVLGNNVFLGNSKKTIEAAQRALG